MAERAVLVRVHPDGRCTVARSRWGGTDRAVAAVCDGRAPTALPSVSWERVDDAPDFRSVVSRLDYLATAALYRVGNGAVTVFCPLWFGLPLPSVVAAPTVGALVAVDSLLAVRSLRQRFRRLKGRLADGIETGAVPAPVAASVLAAAVATDRGRERYFSLTPGVAEGFSPGTGADPP